MIDDATQLRDKERKFEDKSVRQRGEAWVGQRRAHGDAWRGQARQCEPEEASGGEWSGEAMRGKIM